MDEAEYMEWVLYLENNMNTEADTSNLFSIFVVLSTYTRRLKNISQFKEIVERFGEKFIEYPLYRF
ncbi:hypothetical protein KM915_16870 [Cytobacillus oceanisediminis]|uniref:hypothetical protein n=1 Tax=Cytobacillus oceanisediminis TaxID=665099 RepID=UPI001C23B14E|nr:hypothetical protein [Cytobacillus oceanisediminis]MBU8731727.1 hypothetical protein [Cytobacillus oceanisediminis]